MKKRKYTQRRRAEQQRQTRERIVDALIELHEERGPAETTISALAERAGVQRLTVYRHFPSEADLLGACSAKWLGLHPPPDLSAISGDEPRERTRAALRALYDYYRETERMWTSVYRDVGRVPALDEVMAGFEEYLAAARRELARDWGPRPSAALRATLGHALSFSTWQSLTRQGVGRTKIVDLVFTWLCAAAHREPKSSR